MAEIAEGSRILQDQLALMDDKYMELRNRLESSRKLFATQMSRITKESSELRVKYSMATHGKLLDSLPMPDQGAFNFTGGGFDSTFRGSMESQEMMNRTGTSTGPHRGKQRASSARAATSNSHAASNSAMMLMPLSAQSGGREQYNPNGGITPKHHHGNGHGHGHSHSAQDLSHEAWGQQDMPYDVGVHKKTAEGRFVKGMTHNTPFATKVPAISPAEAEYKEKNIIRKINRKSDDPEANAWTQDRLQDLIKS